MVSRSTGVPVSAKKKPVGLNRLPHTPSPPNFNVEGKRWSTSVQGVRIKSLSMLTQGLMLYPNIEIGGARGRISIRRDLGRQAFFLHLPEPRSTSKPKKTEGAGSRRHGPQQQRLEAAATQRPSPQQQRLEEAGSRRPSPEQQRLEEPGPLSTAPRPRPILGRTSAPYGAQRAHVETAGPKVGCLPAASRALGPY